MARIKIQIVKQIGCVNAALSGVYTTTLEFYLGQLLSIYEAKSLGKYLIEIFNFIKGQDLAQIKIQIVK